EGEPHVREYTRAFDELRAAALSPRRTVDFVKNIVKEYTR
ncbi:XRE family transcriptional regulator, partial [Streptomyces sp. TRM76130]|nr:XRE family transcriptional regulator [Streptomyces sp. TRM76130]